MILLLFTALEGKLSRIERPLFIPANGLCTFPRCTTTKVLSGWFRYDPDPFHSLVRQAQTPERNNGIEDEKSFHIRPFILIF